MPEGYVYSPPSAEPPGDPKIKAIYRRATATELAPQTSPVDRDRTSKSKARRQRSRERQAPAKFDAAAFLAQHWQAVFGPLFKRLRLGDADIDGPIGARLASPITPSSPSKSGSMAASGPAAKRWVGLLRELSLCPGNPAR